jgi:hypothetical protein
VGGSDGGSSGARGFPRFQGPAPARPTPAPATFWELAPPQAGGLAECLIELEGPHGKMRVQWKGTAAPDLAGLSRVLWESA